jgi:pimeloyl-ACP methyl ester carboxylesterase
MWRKLIPPFAQRYRVICPDLRGFGWSDAPPGRYEKKTLARDLVRMLELLGLERVRLVGHDWGGFAGFLACLEAPQRFERFVALSIVSPWFRPALGPGLLAGVAYQLPLVAPLVGTRVAGSPAFTRLMLQQGSTRSYSDEEVAAYTDRLSEPERARATVALYRSFQVLEMPAMATGRYVDGRMEVPTLGVYGESDLVVSRGAFDRADVHCDSLDVKPIPGRAHFLPEEAPDEVLERLVPFLN